MIISINGKPCEAQIGDLLLSVAQHHKAHIGYICGGNGICQSCFVTVTSGSELLSPPSATEKAFISEKLLQEGGRLACQATIVGEGRIECIARAEALKRLLFNLDAVGLASAVQAIGANIADRLPSGFADIVARARSGKLHPGESAGKVVGGLGPAAMLLGNSIAETFSFLQEPLKLVGSVTKPAADIAGNLLHTVQITAGSLLEAIAAPLRGGIDLANGAIQAISGGLLQLPGATAGTARSAAIERVTITARKA